MATNERVTRVTIGALEPEIDTAARTTRVSTNALETVTEITSARATRQTLGVLEKVPPPITTRRVTRVSISALQLVSMYKRVTRVSVHILQRVPAQPYQIANVNPMIVYAST